MEADILDSLSWADYAFVSGGVLASSLISGLGGFGGGFIIVGILTPFLGPKATLAVLAVFAFIANLGRIFVYRKSINWTYAVQFTLASLPGVWLGANFLKAAPEDVLMILLGVVLIMAVPLKRFLKKVAFTPGLRTILGIGFVFGIFSGTAAGSGMFVIAALNSVGMSGPLLLGTDAVIGFANNISRISSFYLLDLLQMPHIQLGLIMGVLSFPGTWIASRVVVMMGDKTHNHLIEVILFGMGSFFILTTLFPNLLEF